MRTPSKDEINNCPGDLDQEWALRAFLGKTEAEALGVFEAAANDLVRVWDLSCMGPVAFVYYFPAAFAYLRSLAPDDADMFIAAMIGMMERRLDTDSEYLRGIEAAFPRMLAFCSYCLEQYVSFGWDRPIEAEYEPRLRELLERLA